MGEQHRGVARGLEDLAGRMVIADDGPHVAFVIGVLPDGRPTMWVVQADGTQHELDKFGFTRRDGDGGVPPDPTSGEPRGEACCWTLSDLIDAGCYLHDVAVILPRTGDGAKTHQHAIRRHEHRQDHLLRHMIAVTERRN